MQYLAIHSPVFKTMFFGEFAEKEKDKIELKDVVYEVILALHVDKQIFFFNLLRKERKK